MIEWVVTLERLRADRRQSIHDDAAARLAEAPAPPAPSGKPCRGEFHACKTLLDYEG